MKATRRQFVKAAGGAVVAAAAVSSYPEMPKRILGRTKLSVSLLGFGCAGATDAAIYRRAVDLGVNYFHLGHPGWEFNQDAYAALRPFRDRIVVSHMSVKSAPGVAGLLADLDTFLKLSGFERVDIWYLVTSGPERQIEFSEAFATAREAGKARWAAISTHRLAEDVDRLTTPGSAIDAVMMTYNFTSPPDVSEKLGRLHAAGLGIVPMKPLAGRFGKATANKPGALLRWLAADSRVRSIPVSMTTVEQVEQNVAALGQPLSDEDRMALKAQMAYASPRFCRMCGACDGRCPQGLAVSDLVRTAMYAEGYEDLSLAHHQYAAIPLAQRRGSCQDCSGCSVRCPNGVAIRDRVRLAQALLATNGASPARGAIITGLPGDRS